MKDASPNYQNSERIIRSFGRIKSRKLSDHKNHLLQDLLPRYEISNDFGNSIKNILEIGFGFGDFLFAKASANLNANFFGSEPHINGVVNLLGKLEKQPLPNIKISKQDIRILLTNFPDKFFDEAYILFPDPWPKSKHFKRRLVTADFLEKNLAPKLKNNAKLTIATDHDLYKTWILAEISRCKNFIWEAKSKKDWQIFPDDWIKTKYQKKAEIEGRTPVIFNIEYYV